MGKIYYAIDNDGIHMYHHGVKGQKWGKRLYQNQDGSLTALGKLRYLKNPKEGEALVKKRKKEIAAEKARAAKAAKQEEADKKKAAEEERMKVLKTGTAEEILRRKQDFSSAEIQQAITRINLEKSLIEAGKNYSKAGKEETKTLLEKAETVMNNVDKMRQMTEKGVNAYNTFAKINNSISDKQLPTIGGEKKKENKESMTSRSTDEKIYELIKSGSKEDIVNNLGKFTMQDLNDINKRFQIEDQLKNQVAKAAKEAEEAKAKESSSTSSEAPETEETEKKNPFKKKKKKK